MSGSLYNTSHLYVIYACELETNSLITYPGKESNIMINNMLHSSHRREPSLRTRQSAKLPPHNEVAVGLVASSPMEGTGFSGAFLKEHRVSPRLGLVHQVQWPVLPRSGPPSAVTIISHITLSLTRLFSSSISVY